MRVLITDDHKLLRESIKLIIENHCNNIEVIGCAKDGEEAFDICKNLKPDLVLMDIAMPVCNGIEATKRIKADYPNIKVLILTASYDEIDISDALQNGADGYILKDVGMEELILSIQSTAMGLGIVQRDLLNNVTFVGTNVTKTESKKNRKALEIDGIEIAITKRQKRIMKMIVEGYDNKQISHELFIAEGTVKNNISEIISKLQLRDRTQLAVFAIKNNLV